MVQLCSVVAAPRLPASEQQLSRRRWAVATACTALVFACFAFVLVVRNENDRSWFLHQEGTALVSSIDSQKSGASGGLGQQYLDALHAGSHEVYISSLTAAEKMAGQGEKLSVPCAFGIRCQLHVRPTLREKTRGSWLEESGGGDLASMKPLAVMPSKGPWNNQQNNLLAEAEPALHMHHFIGTREEKTSNALAASEEDIEEEISHTLSNYVKAGGK